MSQQSQPPNATEWGKYMLQLYMTRKPPQPLSTVVYDEIEAKAREVLKDYPGAFKYAFGSAGTSSTYRANLRAFEQYRIVPRMLVDASVRDLSTTIFGKTRTSPIFVAPIGVQGIFMPDGEFSPAKAAATLGIPFIMSTASSRSIEEVGAANGDGGDRWYQLYWPKTDEITLSLLSRAKKSGFTALVVTLDTFSLGWRPHDLETSYLPFGHGVGIQVGSTDPVFMKRHPPPQDAEPGADEKISKFPYEPADFDRLYMADDAATKRAVYLGAQWLGETNSGLYRSWKDLEFLKQNWDGPLVLKGIQSVQDAEKAIDCGVDGIIVSNHGGRQVDGALPSLYALASITSSAKVRGAQESGKFTVLFDSGIRTGSDIIKAIALGAQAVLLGRPWVYGGVVGGEKGVEQVLRHTLADLDVTLGLSGYTNLKEIWNKGEDVVQKIDF